jgi:hypothetical protein
LFGLLSVRYPSAWLVVGFSAKIKRKKFTILVSYNGVGAYVHTNESLSLIFFKTSQLEIKRKSIKQKKEIKLLLLLLNHYWNEVYGFMLKH